MRKGEKLIEGVGELLREQIERHKAITGTTRKMYVFPENIYDYIQNELTDEEFEKIFTPTDGY